MESDISTLFKHSTLGFVSVKYSDFLRFLSGVGVRLECPQCGSEDWNVQFAGSEEDNSERLAVVKIEAAYERWFHPAFNMSCSNCGSVRTIMAAKVIEWLEKHPEPVDGR